MKLLLSNNDKNIILKPTTDFRTDLGWEESFKTFENDALQDIINPSENYETIRLIHSPYLNNTITQCDIWFYFYFNNNGDFNSGLDYSLVNIDPKENAKMLRQSTESFFRLEFYKTPNDELPTRFNRKLVFTKNLSLPLGEKMFYTVLNDDIFVPVFTGNNYRNKENMYLFWFINNNFIDDKILNSDLFWVSLKFFNAKDGSILDFTNKPKTINEIVSETDDMYLRMYINRNNYTYQIYDFLNVTRLGTTQQPIKFYEKIN